MKRSISTFLILLSLILLAGCGARYPAETSTGEPWDKSWEILGSVLGVEELGGDFTLLDNNAILTTQDTYLATWVCGEAKDFVNAEGADADLYEAELFVLLQGCKDEENAQLAIDAWMELARESYDFSEPRTEVYNGQAYTVLTYTVDSETNPYCRGVSAFAVFENYAVNAEITCAPTYSGDEAAILADFLGGCHYAAADK